MCDSGMFWCVFEAVFGFGLGVIAVLYLAAMLGMFDKR